MLLYASTFFPSKTFPTPKAEAFCKTFFTWSVARNNFSVSFQSLRREVVYSLTFWWFPVVFYYLFLFWKVNFFAVCCVKKESTRKVASLIFNDSDKALTCEWLLFAVGDIFSRMFTPRDKIYSKRIRWWSCRRNKTHKCFALIFSLSREEKKNKFNFDFICTRVKTVLRLMKLNKKRRESGKNPKCHFRINSCIKNS